MEPSNIKTAKMKKIELIETIALFLISICSTAQVISVEDYGSNYLNKGLTEDGITHVKDFNNVLDKYEGTWTGESNGKQITFAIKSITHINDVGNLPIIKFDKLLIKHIIKVNNVAIDDTTILEDTHPRVIEGSYLADTGHYVLHYISKERDCAQDGKLYIYIDNNNTTLKCSLIRQAEFINPEVCDGVDVFKFIPETFELTKS